MARNASLPRDCVRLFTYNMLGRRLHVPSPMSVQSKSCLGFRMTGCQCHPSFGCLRWIPARRKLVIAAGAGTGLLVARAVLSRVLTSLANWRPQNAGLSWKSAKG